VVLVLDGLVGVVDADVVSDVLAELAPGFFACAAK
jgi:hypothetical protein